MMLQKNPYHYLPIPAESKLNSQCWYHGNISRNEAEELIKIDGDFLVRKSQTIQGQLVLNGMLNGQHQHLKLINMETRQIPGPNKRTFSSVVEFIEFHIENQLGVLFNDNENELQLLNPIVSRK